MSIPVRIIYMFNIGKARFKDLDDALFARYFTDLNNCLHVSFVFFGSCLIHTL